MREIGTTVTSLLIIALLLPATSGQAEATSPDLRVEGIVVLGDPAWTDGEPSPPAALEVTVVNEGQAPAAEYRLTYEWEDASGTRTPLRGTESESFDVSEEPLPGGGGPDSRRTHTVPEWALQEEQVGAGRILVHLEALGQPDADPSDDTGMLPLAIAYHDIDVSASGEAVEIRTDETRFVRITVANHGNVAETVGLSILDAGQGDTARLDLEMLPSTVSVAPGQTRQAHLFIEYPFTGDPRPLEADLAVQVSPGYDAAYRLSLPTVTDTQQPPSAGFGSDAFRLSSGTLFLAPGSEASATVQVRNTGQQPESFRVRASAPADWAASAVPSRLALLPGETATAQLDVTAPAAASAGSGAELRLELTADHDPQDPHVILVPARVSGPAPMLTGASVANSRLYAGENISMSVTVANEGDTVPGEAIHVRVTGDGLPMTEAVVPRIEPASQVGLSVDAGSAPAGGSLPLHVQLLTEAGGILDSRSVVVTVREPSLAISAPAPLAGTPGQSITYLVPPHVFLLHNNGSLAETFDVAIHAVNGTAVLDSSATVTIQPGQNRSVAFRHELPLPAGTLQEDRVTVDVTVRGRPAWSWSARVESTITDVDPPRITWSQPVPSPWSASDAMPVAVTASDDGVVAAVALSVTGPGGNVTTVPMVVDGEAWYAAHRFDRVGEHLLRVTARDGAGNQETSRPTTVHVQQIAPPTIHVDLPANGTVAAGQAAVNVTITSSFPVETVAVRFDDSDDRFLRNHTYPVTAGHVAIPVHDMDGGATMRIVVVDAAGARSELVVMYRLPPPLATESADPLATKESPWGAGAWPALLLAAAALAVCRRRDT